MPRCSTRFVLPLLLTSLLGGCSFHTLATNWHGHVGQEGKPVWVLSSLYIGANVGILFPLIGRTQIDEMIEESTKWIKDHGGNRIRLVETESNNYWYGIPPLSWFVTPMGTSVTFEYEPSAQALAAAGYNPDGSLAEDAAATPGR